MRVVVAAVVLAAAGCNRHTPEEVESDAVVSVKTAPAVLGDIRGVVHATGVVSPAPGAELVVVAPEAARIAEIPRAAGDRVRRGDILVRFEVPSSSAEVQRQHAEVTRAQASLDAAKAAQVRAAGLYDRGVAARKEVEEANRAAADAQAAVTQARASLVAAQAVAGRAAVRATFDGIVAKRLHNPGDLVEPSASDPVLRVIDPHRLEVVAMVPLADASRVAVGAAAQLAGAPFNSTDIRLKVISSPAAVEDGTAAVPVRLGLASPTTVPVGAPVRVDIEAEHRKNVILIPATAIVREAEETAVFVARDGKAQRRLVRTGLNDGRSVEVVSGVKTGELVIVDGQAGLPDGAAIAIAPTEAKTPASGEAKEKTQK